jgi:hypothetical protein
VSIVIVADACPSICWTTFTSAPALVRVQPRDSDGRGRGFEVTATEDGGTQRRAAADPGEHEVVGRQQGQVGRELLD